MTIAPAHLARCLAAALAVAAAIALAFGAAPAAAVPPNGSVEVTPGAANNIVIVGHSFVMPIGMTTCGVAASDSCYIGATQLAVSVDGSRLNVVSDAGTSTGSNGAATFVDAGASWKLNQWAGSRVVITAGTGAGQSRLIAANNATSLTLVEPWTAIPDSSSSYTVGGMSNGSFLDSAGRTSRCAPSQSTATTAALTCITFGPSDYLGATGTGTVASVALTAHTTGVAALSFPLEGNLVATAEGNPIFPQLVQGARRVIICPDPNSSGGVNVADLLLIAMANGQMTGGPLYAPTKDPDESGQINVIDLSVTAAVSNKACVQP